MRFIIHAGFPKCGSSSIQEALFDNHARLRARSIYLFGRDLTINRGDKPCGYPLWSLVEGRKPEQTEAIRAHIASELNAIRAAEPNATAILTSEVLAEATLAELVRGIDQDFDTSVITYIRPQFRWIPSAWKQWHLKEGATLAAYTERCLTINEPGFRRSIEGWKSIMPDAKVFVRILEHSIVERGGPAEDFFALAGLGREDWVIDRNPRNPSFDFSILHVLSKNPHLFEDSHSNTLYDGLARTLPRKYLSTNIDMLSEAEEKRIAAHFHRENLHVLTNHCPVDGMSAEDLYDTYFKPRASGRAYADVPELEIIYRCLGILLEALPRQKERSAKSPRKYEKTIVRPPYWKMPWRVLKRLGWPAPST